MVWSEISVFHHGLFLPCRVRVERPWTWGNLLWKQHPDLVMIESLWQYGWSIPSDLTMKWISRKKVEMTWISGLEKITFPIRSSEFAKWLNSFECSSKTLNFGCLTDCSTTKFQKWVKNVFKNPVVLRFRRCNLLIMVSAAFDPVFTLNKNHKK